MGFSWPSGIKTDEVGEIIHYWRKCEEMRPSSGAGDIQPSWVSLVVKN